MRLIHTAIILALLGGCRGELAGNNSDASTEPDVETDGGTADMTTQPDMPVDTACDGVTCGDNALCVRGDCFCEPGFMGDPMAGCTEGNPCASVDCGFGSTCNDDGECPCDPGFTETNTGQCEAQELSPDDRTKADVCDRWNSDFPIQAGVQWQERPSEQCEPGILDPAYQMDALRRVSLFRWLSGLGPVTSNTDYMGLTQACATALAAEDMGVRGQISEDWACYSEQASDGVLASNTISGATSAADSVVLYMTDEGVASLGHRRWILFPELGATAFGFRDGYSCMYTSDRSAFGGPDFVAYPFATFPDEGLVGPWSWSSEALGFDDSTTVTITDSSDAEVTVENVREAEGDFGWPTLAWDVPDAVAGEDYTVTIAGLAGEMMEVSYTVSLVQCE
jgi:hypothetical protein